MRMEYGRYRCPIPNGLSQPRRSLRACAVAATAATSLPTADGESKKVYASRTRENEKKPRLSTAGVPKRSFFVSYSTAGVPKRCATGTGRVLGSLFFNGSFLRQLLSAVLVALISSFPSQ